ncbi:unnamed protein product [Adineta steineri]|uniref:SGNH hydrolase-type esterase domain-containing protein n=1 Tax=Adineta steineri TaxID=433720 RepID=A0A819N4T2_9BILA|nr:unnamed protein product [Adineta steineri]
MTKISFKTNIFYCIMLMFSTIAAQKPWEAVPRTDAPWLTFHQAYVQQAAQAGANIKVMFYGDSIIQRWGIEGLQIWLAKYLPRGSVDNGIEGDITQNVLWRIRNGELTGLNPKLVVLMIGTNNINQATPDEIAVGVQTICQEFRQRLPNTRILLLGLTPRSDGTAVSDIIALINSKLINLDNGYWIRFLNMISSFEISHTQVKPELYIDSRHLTEAGYQTWYTIMEPLFAEMIQ